MNGDATGACVAEPVCSWTSYSWLFGDEKCEEQATRIVTTGCVHEHVIRNLTCDDCAESLPRTLSRALCTPCRTGGADNVHVVIVSDESLSATDDSRPDADR